MSSGRKVSFREPNPRDLRDNGPAEASDHSEGDTPRRAQRSRSPYPRYYHSGDDSEDDSENDGDTDRDANSDEGDESLQRYKESLGLSGGNDLSDPNDPRVCIIQSLTMESPGRDPVVIDLSAPGSADNLKKNPFKIKEGAIFTMSAQFRVQHEILSGLHYVQVIKRKGIRIPGGKSDEMIVSRVSLIMIRRTRD